MLGLVQVYILHLVILVLDRHFYKICFQLGLLASLLYIIELHVYTLVYQGGVNMKNR